MNLIRKISLLVILFISSFVSATTLTGNIKAPDGTNFNGRLALELSMTASVLTTGSCGGPYIVIGGKPVQFNIVNGAMPGGASVVGNDCLAPQNTCYIVDEYDSNNNHLSQFRWSITGTTVDVGTLTPQTSTCPIAPVGDTLPGPLTILGDLIVTGNLNSGTTSFPTNVSFQNITSTGVITGVISAAGVPTGNYLESNGSTYQASNGAASGVGNCATGTPNSVVAALNSDAPPTCYAIQATDINGIFPKSNLPTATVYTDQANVFAIGHTQSFFDGTNTEIANASDATKIAKFDLSALATGTTVTEKIPNIATGTYQKMYKEVSPETIQAFLAGNLSSSWTALSWTPAQSITVTRVEITSKVSTFSCSVPPIVKVQSAGGGSPISVNITAANSTSGLISAGMTGGFAVTITVTGGTCTTYPADANVVVSYIFQ